MPLLLCCLLLFVPIERPKPDDATPEEEAAQQLAKVRRIYISVLTGGDAALQIRDLLMTSLQRSKQFIITEDEDKADAVLKGSGDDDVFTDTHQSSEGINAHSQFGAGESEATGTARAAAAIIRAASRSARTTAADRRNASTRPSSRFAWSARTTT